MMDMNDMMDRCANAMGSMMGGDVIGGGIMLGVLLAILLVWLIGLGVVGALIIWGVRHLSRSHA